MIKLYNDDCIYLMKRLYSNQVDLVLADPPYGVTQFEWDKVINTTELWECLDWVTKKNAPIVIFGQGKFTIEFASSNLKDYRYSWIWEKTRATGHLNANKKPLKCHEDIMVFYKEQPTYNPQKSQGHKPVNAWNKTKKNQNNEKFYNLQNKEFSGGGNTDRFPRSILKYQQPQRGNKFHPTEKPQELLEFLILTYTNEGDTVLDFCMGSGSTGVACKKLNRKFIGIEIDEEYFNIAKNRLKEEQCK